MIKPTVSITRTSVDQMTATLMREGAREARIMAEADAAAMLAVANSIIAEELQPRTGRRHKANTTHLANALTARVVQPRKGHFPITVELLPKPGVSAKKIAALEYGVDHEYPIPKDGPKEDGYLRWGSAPGDLRKPFQKSVTWKPTGKIRDGYHFMERARDIIAARRKRSR